MSALTAEKHVEQLQREIVELRDEFQNFVYLVSHDLQAPFRSIIGFSRLIMESAALPDDERTRRHFSMVIRGGEKGQAMVEGLLQYSRIYTQANPHSMVDMNQSVHLALHKLEQDIASSGATITAEDLPTLMGEKNQLYLAWYHLLHNAIKFRKEGVAPVIHIRATKKDNVWHFSITDNGIGIEENAREKMFEVFRRQHGEEEYPGIGMGLPIARRVLERHGGTITIAPMEGEGTHIAFRLPETATTP